MKKNDNSLIGHYVTSFLTRYLPGQRNVSSNTISSYASTLYLFFIFCRDKKNMPAEIMSIDNINKELVIGFLDWIEQERNSSISTRNQRLAAIRSFFKYLQYENPQIMGVCQEILCIPSKKGTRPTINHLTHEEIRAIFNQPDLSTDKGKRSLAIMTLLYDTGARVSELINLNVCDVRYDSPAVITLTGKGRKIRYVPIMDKTLHILESYMIAYKIDKAKSPTLPLFYNSRGERLTRAGITNIIARHVSSARNICPSLPNTVTPHMFRHTKAVHLTEIDTPLIYIRDLLGHASVITTEIYIRLNPERRKKYMEAAHVNYVDDTNNQDWSANDEIISWLKQLCK